MTAAASDYAARGAAAVRRLHVLALCPISDESCNAGTRSILRALGRDGLAALGGGMWTITTAGTDALRDAGFKEVRITSGPDEPGDASAPGPARSSAPRLAASKGAPARVTHTRGRDRISLRFDLTGCGNAVAQSLIAGENEPITCPGCRGFAVLALLESGGAVGNNAAPWVAALSEIRELLWPGGDPEHEWSSDTLDDVARVLTRIGFGPRPR